MSTSAEVVICGAGIAGVATAYELAVRRGIRDVLLIDERPPLTLTSDKSTECYRNWWPGPGDAMVRMMNRSIDLVEEMARQSGNLFHLNRRGYLYITDNPDRVEALHGFADEASSLGAGEVRHHNGMSATATYEPHLAEGFEAQPEGADLITNRALSAEHFPYLSKEVVGLLHVRRAGWLSAQQFGAYLLERAREYGAQLISSTVEAVELEAGGVKSVSLADGTAIATSTFVNAAGPMIGSVAQLFGVDLPVYNELHLKAAFNDQQVIVDREAPLLIYADEQELDWSAEERAFLAEEEETRWLTERLPSGAHARPEGGHNAQTLLILWDIHEEPVELQLPPPLDPEYAEIALRGLCRIIPGLRTYVGRLPKPFVDGGYYTKTRENRPLACPTTVPGAYVIGAFSGYGIMCAAAMAELLAAHICGDEAAEYAPAFDLSRYEDSEYQDMLQNWGETWQL